MAEVLVREFASRFESLSTFTQTRVKILRQQYFLRCAPYLESRRPGPQLYIYNLMAWLSASIELQRHNSPSLWMSVNETGMSRRSEE